jgi:hypothetical protein
LDAPALRTVFLSMLDGFSEVEYSKRMLAELLRRKEAEATAAEAKHAKLLVKVAELRQGFHERVTIMHSERIELAQAVCSPTSKKHGQLAALRAMNTDLEVKISNKHLDLLRVLTFVLTGEVERRGFARCEPGERGLSTSRC